VLFEGTGNVLQESGSLFWDNTNGRLGIGTATPSTTLQINGGVLIGNGTAGDKLEINGRTTGVGGSGSVLKITQNQSWSGSLPYALEVVGYTFLNNFRINGSDGERSLYNVTNDAQLGFATTGNGIITFTQNSSTERMRIATTGNVLIGTTTDAGYKLDVNGTARINSELTVFNGLTASGRIATFYGYQAPYQWEASIEVGMQSSNEGVALIGGSNITNNRGGFLQTKNGQRAISWNALGIISVGTAQVTSSQYSALSIGGGQATLGTLVPNTTGVQLAVLSKTISHIGSASTQAAISFNSFAASSLSATLVPTTYTDAYNVYIAGPPTAGTNVTLTNTYSLYVNSGKTYLGGNVLIGTTTDAASSILTVESTTKGFLPPRMTTTQKNAISSPATGLVVYDSTLNVLNFYNGSSWTSGSSGGTVTSVAALTLGTTGTDLSSTVATGTTTPVITLNVPTASAANRGALSSADWTTFNGKQAALVSGTNIKTVNGTTLLGSGNLVIPVFQLQGTNYLSVLANGTPAQNGQAVRDAYTAAQAMTPNGSAKSINNRVVILLAPGYYSFSEATLGAFTINQSYIDFESLSGETDVYFSSMQVTSPFPGINVRISGINTLVNNYYTHGAFAVASTGDSSEDIYIKNCVGGDYSFCAFSSAFTGTIENCSALTFSFLYNTTAAPPAGITSGGGGINLNLYGTFKNCTASSTSFLYSDTAGTVDNYGTIDNCTSGYSSFLYGTIVNNNGTISNCIGTDHYSFLVGGDVFNNGLIVNCRGGNFSFIVTFNPTSVAENYGRILNCDCTSMDGCFVSNVAGFYTGTNYGRISNCTAYNSIGAFCGNLGSNNGFISNCIAGSKAFCCDNASGINEDILRCTMTGDTFTVGATGGGRVVLGIDNTGVVNY
jgi:hypothetical protein